MQQLLILLISALWLQPMVSFGQASQKSGIFLTAADYQAGKLTHEINCGEEKHRIKLHEFLTEPYIEVIHNGEKFVHQKKETYGFRNCDAKDYRFVENDHFQILESGRMYLYEKQQLVSPKDAGTRKAIQYFFSTVPDSPLMELTLANLKKAYPDNHPFHDLLDVNFRNDAELAAFDPTHRMYKVNHLLNNTVR